MLSFLASHQPPGTLGQGLTTGTVDDQINMLSEEIGHLGPRVAAAELDFWVVAGPTGSGSDVRIDATVALIPRRPPDTMVPGGDIVAVVSVTGPPPGSDGPVPLPVPERVVVTSRELVAKLRAAADQLQVMAVMPMSCPADFGVRYVVAFAPSAQAAPNITFTAGVCWNLVDVSAGSPHQGGGADYAPRVTGLLGQLSDDASFTNVYDQVLAHKTG